MSPARPTGAMRLAPAEAVALVAVVVCFVAAVMPPPAAIPLERRPPNVLLVVTDDQPYGTLPTTFGPPAMPWLEERLEDPTDHWVRFTDASVNVPLCCPSRATILSGRYAHHTGVEDNDDGAAFDESSTLATWLEAAGYRTAFVGKYLNGYPWGRGPYVPAGWDRFVAKRNAGFATTYEGYPFVDQGVPLVAGPAPSGYATTVLADEALTFLRGAAREQPWFLVFAPTAPHEPSTPAAEDAGSFARAPIATPSQRLLNDVRGKPGWVRASPPIDTASAAALEARRRLMLESLGEVDRAVGSLVAEVQARGELDRTLIVIVSDNGYSFGEHRWVGKRCPYDSCVHTPFVVRSPWRAAGEVSVPVSNVDLAPTIRDLVGAYVGVPTVPTDGVSLRPLLDARIEGELAREGVLIEWAGDGDVPPWKGVRTEAFSYLEHADGTVELYDLAGVLGKRDPDELRNKAHDPAYADVVRELAAMLVALADDPPLTAAP